MSRAIRFWRPEPDSKWYGFDQFVETVLSIITATVGLALFTWSVVSTNDGRIKALLLWAIGTSCVFAYMTYRVFKRENVETRYGKALYNYHQAHHRLRDAAYSRYIADEREADWKPVVEDALGKFARAFSIATGASCHATIKLVLDPASAIGDTEKTTDSLEVQTYARSVARTETRRPGVRSNTVGNNTDFRYLFDPEKKDNRCWYHQDLLTLEGYDNANWPEHPSPSNVPYRSTMVWPIRKVIREGSATTPNDHYIHGFLTIDSKEPRIFVYERHFDLGAGFADHLFSVLWDVEVLRQVHKEIKGGD